MTNTAREFLSRRGRAVWSLLLFIVALILLVALNSQGHFRSAPGELGPRFWPQLGLTLMLLLTALDASLAFWSARKQAGVAPLAPSAADEAGPPESLSLLAAGMALVIVYAAATLLIGFALATLMFLIAFSYLGGYRRIWPLLLFSVGTTLAVLYIFVYLVYISLPLGEGPFLEMNVALYRLLGLF